MTQLQEYIVSSIYSSDPTYFVDLGGWENINLDIVINENLDTPLLLACAKVNAEVIKNVLKNPTINVERIDK